MKGTLFSSDFVLASNGDAKLIEVNTDTGFISSSLTSTYFDASNFISILSGSNITQVDVIYKGYQEYFVNWLESEITANASFITTFNKHQQNSNTIYPETIADSSEKFILRMAYDESALFDSIYCKNKTSVLDLMNEYTASDYIPPYYSSIENESLLSSSLNDTNNFPDFVVKSSTHQTPVQFVKVGHSESSSLERIQAFVNEYSFDTTGSHAEKFEYETGDLSDNKVRTLRSFDCIYGSNLELVNFGRYSVQSIFELPTDVSYTPSASYDNSYVKNQFDSKHSFEFGTKYPQSKYLGVWAQNSTSGSVSSSLFSTLSEGDTVTTFYVEGAPDTENEEQLEAWSVTGKTLPVNSYVTSSIIDNLQLVMEPYKVISEINLESGNSVYMTDTKLLISYNTSSNNITYKPVFDLTTDDYLYKVDGTLDRVNSTYMVISDEDVFISETNVEAVDNLVLSGSEIIVHNAPCFVAGTKVHIEEKGITNIEDVEVGDKVVTYNHDNDTAEYKKVLETMVKENQNVVTYVFENGTELTGTPDHPLFVLGKGYSSYNPKLTKEDSGLDVEQILIEDEVLHIDGYGIKITDIMENENKQTVYNLKNVEDNHNFFANDLLAHNRVLPPCCFKGTTEVQLDSGEQKQIKDIVVGDSVRVWDFENQDYTSAEVTAINSSTTLSAHVSRNESLGYEGKGYFVLNGIEKVQFTPEHPFLTKDGWKALTPDSSQEPFATEQEPKVLQIGDFISCEGEWMEVGAIDFIPVEEDETVYNITVEEHHSYLVDGIVVHNK